MRNLYVREDRMIVVLLALLHKENGAAEGQPVWMIACVTSGADLMPTLSIGDPPRFYGPRDTALGTLGSLGLASISVVVGAVLAVVVAVRRGSHRARLREQRTDANHG